MSVAALGGYGLDGVLTEGVSLIAGLVTGLIAGLVTGLFFERKAIKSAKGDKEDLMRQVSVLKTMINSIGGNSGRAATGPPVPQDLAGLVTERAIATQDSAGRVQRRALVAHFLEQGRATRDIDAAISSLCKAGITREDDPWLQMMA